MPLLGRCAGRPTSGEEGFDALKQLVTAFEQLALVRRTRQLDLSLEGAFGLVASYEFVKRSEVGLEVIFLHLHWLSFALRTKRSTITSSVFNF